MHPPLTDDVDFRSPNPKKNVAPRNYLKDLPQAPRIRNLTTGHRPLVAHGCGGHGRWFLSDTWKGIRGRETTEARALVSLFVIWFMW